MSTPAPRRTRHNAVPPPAGVPTTGWKIRASLWVFLCVGTFGLGSPWIVLTVAMRARRIWWIGVGVVLCGCLLLAFVWLEGTKMWQSDAADWLLMTSWLGSSAFAAGVNPQYLEIKWRRRQGTWTVQQDIGRTTPRNKPAASGSADVRPDAPASFPPAQSKGPQAPRAVLDVNSAGAHQFSTLPGFTPDLAALAVDLRTRRGPYTSVDQFADVLGLQPHVYARVRGRLACRAAPPAPPTPPTFGRRVDY